MTYYITIAPSILIYFQPDTFDMTLQALRDQMVLIIGLLVPSFIWN